MIKLNPIKAKDIIVTKELADEIHDEYGVRFSFNQTTNKLSITSKGRECIILSEEELKLEFFDFCKSVGLSLNDCMTSDMINFVIMRGTGEIESKQNQKD